MRSLRESWPLVAAASTCTCFALEYGSPALFRRLSKGYSALDEKQRLDWDVRCVGLLHAVVVGVGSLRVVFSPDPAILDDRFFGYSDESQLFIAIALGYFVWDIVACIRHSWGAGFILHAVACLITYFVCSYPRPFVHYCACFFLLYELSTPFMHIRQFCIALKKTDTVVFKLANALFPLVFFAVRLVAGITFSYDWAYRQWEFVNTHPERDTAAIAVCCYLYVANLVSNCLNLYWFGLIIIKGLARSQKKE